jgi:murein DD-endopeptidase MepM/ murein hydrolase activator NlpD
VGVKIRLSLGWLIILAVLAAPCIFFVPAYANIGKLPEYPQKGQLSKSDVYARRPETGIILYQVKAGDTFLEILKKQGISTGDALKAAKKIDKKILKKIKPGGEIDLILNRERTSVIEIGYTYQSEKRKVLFKGQGLNVMVPCIASSKSVVPVSAKPVAKLSDDYDAKTRVSVIESFKPISVETAKKKSSDVSKLRIINIKKGQSLSSVLRKNGLKPNEISKISRAIKPVYDIRNMKSGDEVKLWIPRNKKDCLEKMECTVGGKILTVSKADGVYTAAIAERNAGKEVYPDVFAQKVNDSEKREPMKKPAEIIAGNIEFLPGMVPWSISDDSYGTLDGKDNQEKFDSIFNASLPTKLKFKNAMYQERLKILKAKIAAARQFLKAPLSYRKITSKFAWRINPVTGNPEHHTGVDYAAPYGTPVKAICNGKVVFAGWRNGYGSTIQVRHHDGYLSQYAHLSRYAKGITKGRQVKRGDIIGYVGSSGMSTGPHLDLRVSKAGVYVNPLSLNKSPKKYSSYKNRKKSRSLTSTKSKAKRSFAYSR